MLAGHSLVGRAVPCFRGGRLWCSIIGTVLAVGFGLAGLMVRTMARLDRRIDNDKAASDADRRAHQTQFDTAMDAFRTEKQRLAERQSHVEGRVDGREAGRTGGAT